MLDSILQMRKQRPEAVKDLEVTQLRPWDHMQVWLVRTRDPEKTCLV